MSSNAYAWLEVLLSKQSLLSTSATKKKLNKHIRAPYKPSNHSSPSNASFCPTNFGLNELVLSTTHVDDVAPTRSVQSSFLIRSVIRMKRCRMPSHPMHYIHRLHYSISELLIDCWYQRRVWQDLGKLIFPCGLNQQTILQIAPAPFDWYHWNESKICLRWASRSNGRAPDDFGYRRQHSETHGWGCLRG